MSEREETAELLETAARLLRTGQAHRAAWRVADAGWLLRAQLEMEGHTHLAGLDETTGRGSILPDPGREKALQQIHDMAEEQHLDEIQSIAHRAMQPNEYPSSEDQE